MSTQEQPPPEDEAPLPSDEAGVTGLSRFAEREDLLDETAKSEFLWKTYDYINTYIQFADTKAAFVGTIASAFLGVMYSGKAHLPMLAKRITRWPFGTWCVAIGALFLMGTVLLAFSTIRPRLRVTRTKGFIYWGDIAGQGSAENFRGAFHKESQRSLNDHLLHTLYHVSDKVSIPKYRAVALSMTLLAVGALISALGLVLNDSPENQPTAPVSAPVSR